MRLPTESVTSAPARGLVASRHAEPTATATVTTVKSRPPDSYHARSSEWTFDQGGGASLGPALGRQNARRCAARALHHTGRDTARNGDAPVTFHIETVASAPFRRSVSPRPSGGVTRVSRSPGLPIRQLPVE